MIDFSQHGEQEVILNYFDGRTGVLLDIGANDGITFSNSYALMQLGWRGHLVDPSPKAFDRLKALYADNEKAWLWRCAIGKEHQLATLYESGPLVNCDDIALVSTLIPQETERWKRVSKPEHKVVDYEEKAVQVINWGEFLGTCQDKNFDFITIDTEGCELEILAQMNLRKLGVQLLCVEHNSVGLDRVKALVDMPVLFENRTNVIFGKR